MSPLPRQGWFFLTEFLKWYFSKYWQVPTRQVFAQTVTYGQKFAQNAFVGISQNFYLLCFMLPIMLVLCSNMNNIDVNFYCFNVL